MILVNRNFGNPVLSEVIGDMFRGSSDTGMKVDWVPNSGALATGSSLVATLQNVDYYAPTASNSGYDGTAAQILAKATPLVNSYNAWQLECQNFYIVTEKFIKTLDKVYTKIWNESFTETGIYSPSNLATMYYGFVTNNSAGASSGFMTFKKFVDRCITAGILVEADRLDYQDQIFISGMSRANMSTQIDLTNKLVTFTHSSPIDIAPDINAMTGTYLYGKKLFIMMSPYQTNESVIKGQTETSGTKVTQEPFWNDKSIVQDTNTIAGTQTWSQVVNTPVRRPIAFFKPKTDASKFGRSLPLATHFIWSIGTPADKALAEANNQTPPDLIFDHLDRISHIDSLVLKIKYDKLQF